MTDHEKAYTRELKAAEAQLNEQLNSQSSPDYSPAELARITESAVLDAQFRASEGER
jgi:hypothetical protein